MEKTIKAFNETKTKLIETLKDLKEHIIKYERLSNNITENHQESASVKRIDNQIKNLKDGTFKIMIVGEFSTGKSTFLNAILGENILPMAIKPTTATINLIKFNEEKKAIVHYFGKQDKESKQEVEDGKYVEIPIDELIDYSTSLNDDSDKVSQNIKLVEVLYPNQYCKEGVEILDTPGLNSTYEHHERATIEYLPYGNSGIMLFNAGQFLTKSESDYLQRFKKYLNKMFFVVNKIDKEDDDELKEAIPFWKNQLKEILGENSEIRLYPLSAKKALKGDVVESRLREFISDFEAFLISDEKAKEMIIPPIMNAQAEIESIVSNIKLKTKSFNFSPKEFKLKIKANEPKLERAKRRKNEIENFIYERSNYLKDNMRIEYNSLVRNGLQNIEKEILDFPGEVDELKEKLNTFIKDIFTSLVFEFQKLMESELNRLNNDVLSRVDDLRDDLSEFKASIIGSDVSSALVPANELQISSETDGFDLAVEYGGYFGIGWITATILGGPIGWIAAIGSSMLWGLFSEEKRKEKQLKEASEKVKTQLKEKLDELYPNLEEKFSEDIFEMRNKTSELFKNLIEDVEKSINEIKREMQNAKETVERKIEQYDNIERRFLNIKSELTAIKQNVVEY